jgi:hypothetical protein
VKAVDKLWRILVADAEESGKRTRAESEEVRKGAEGIGRRGCVIKAA